MKQALSKNSLTGQLVPVSCCLLCFFDVLQLLCEDIMCLRFSPVLYPKVSLTILLSYFCQYEFISIQFFDIIYIFSNHMMLSLHICFLPLNKGMSLWLRRSFPFSITQYCFWPRYWYAKHKWQLCKITFVVFCALAFVVAVKNYLCVSLLRRFRRIKQLYMGGMFFRS